ncbi:HD domain-containing protein [Terasakiella sp. A23]|uniref:HD domain-containing phosphohydrolase n=1 Tax=Terasakiella sp. FCG-A23 TaxID=3080561 RepID=UPI002954EEC0|nr:HD domain-containing phosphohydrolase [Terasakiella sp. A23]MDV7340506.1 HD domain-containing protein [Terasakiella sp. A23]
MSKDFEMIEMDVGIAAHTVTTALDYVGVDDRSHGRRVGLICHRISHYLGWGRDKRHFSLLAGMLHDCGVSSTATHQKLLDEIEWSGADEHCARGEFFLSSFEPFKHYKTAVRYHHTRWEKLPDDLDDETKEIANLIFLADRLDVEFCVFNLNNPKYRILQKKEFVLNKLESFIGTLFSEKIFEAARKAVQKDSFWLELRDEYLDEAIFETLAYSDHSVTLSFNQVEALGELISLIVDAKSPFTHFHSLRVADLAYTIAGLMGLEEKDRRTLRIAGLLHDVGKLRTPDEILEKPEALTEDESSQMRSHPLDSKRVLKAIFPNTPIAKWASEHHEKLDGSGYPFGWSADQIDLPTRILTIADIFQALCQKRPYRARLKAEKVINIMEGMVADGQLDREVFDMARANADELYKIAIREGTSS